MNDESVLIKIVKKRKFINEYLKLYIRSVSLQNTLFWKWRQHRLLCKSLKYANKNCEHYRKLGIAISGWRDIVKYPLLNKNDIKRVPNDFLVDNFSKKLFFIGRTGGSTGEPLEIYRPLGHDPIFQKKLWKHYGYKNGDVILALDGSKVDEKAIQEGNFLYKKNDKQMPYGGWGLSSLYLTDNNISDYCKALIDLKPDFIRGYPSFIYRLARYISDNNIEVSFPIKAIEVTSEMSYAFQRELIERVFSTVVFGQYGHTEAIVFGYTYDKNFRYRIEPLYGYVEIVKENGENAKIGEEGEIVCTSLYNNVMPLIRYRTGDRAVYGGEDKYGIIIEELLGRTQDYIINMDGEKVLLTALIFAQHFDALGNIERWQLEQFEPGNLVMHIIKAPSYTVSDEEEIRELFFKSGKVQTQFDYVDSVSVTQRGKSLMLIQHLDVS